MPEADVHLAHPRVKAAFMYASLCLLFAVTAQASDKRYVAFSIAAARSEIAASKDAAPLRTRHLGGITKVVGAVYDKDHNDIIIVGLRDPRRALLTLDDLVVALRARFALGQWPVVSIDPVERDGRLQDQVVRYEGGIRGTEFGQSLFQADLALKQIAMGLQGSGVPGLQTYWDLTRDARVGIPVRFWFYPARPRVSVRGDVALIHDASVAVFTEQLAWNKHQEPAGDAATSNTAGENFAAQFNANFAIISQNHPAILRLLGLSELVALTRAMEEMQQKPDLSYWVVDYPLGKVDAVDRVELFTRRDDARRRWMSGGVALTAIAMKRVGGAADAIALEAQHDQTLKRLVLDARKSIYSEGTNGSPVVWEFHSRDDAVYVTNEAEFDRESTLALYSHAEYLRRYKRFGDAIEIYDEIIRQFPEVAELYVARGLAHYGTGSTDLALRDFDSAGSMRNRLPVVPYLRGMVFVERARYEDAIEAFDVALGLNPLYCPALAAKVVALERMNLIRKAMAQQSLFLHCSAKETPEVIQRVPPASARPQRRLSNR